MIRPLRLALLAATLLSPATLANAGEPPGLFPLSAVDFTACTGYVIGSGTPAATCSQGIPPSALPAPTASALGGVKAATAPASELMLGIDTTGAPIFAEPTAPAFLNSATITATGSSVQLILQKPSSGNAVSVFGETGTSGRWVEQLGDATAETGGNAGSNFTIGRYNDGGTLIDAPLTISRATGQVTVADGITGNLTGNASTASAAPAGALTGSTLASGVTSAPGLTSAAGGSFGTFAFQSYASPPAIGGTTPAAGNFTGLTATSIGVGTASPFQPLEVSTTTQNTGIAATVASAGGGDPHLYLRSAEGSIASPTAMLSGDQMGSVTYQGYNGASYQSASRVASGATQNWSTSAEGSNLEFYVTPNNATAGALALTIDQNGALIASSLASSGTSCVEASSSGTLSLTGAACGSGSGAVNSVTNNDGSLHITPTTGSVVASLAVAHANTWTATQTISGGASLNVTGAAASHVYSGSSTDYLDQYAYGNADTPIVGESMVGGPGMWGATRTSGGSGASIGVGAFGFNDQTGTQSAWGIYGECRQYPAAAGSGGICLTNEQDITNLGGSSVSVQPYSMPAAGMTVNLWLMSGGGCVTATKCYDPANGTDDLASGPASAAIGIGNNGSTYESGIVFSANAIQGTNGSDASSAEVPAISLARTHFINWYQSSGGTAFSLGSIGTSTGPGGRLLWTDSGLVLQNGAGTNLVLINGSSIDIGAHAGVSCSGAPSGSFASVGGIVTHC